MLIQQHQSPWAWPSVLLCEESDLFQLYSLESRSRHLRERQGFLIQKHLFLCERHKRHVRVIEIFEKESEKLKYKKAPGRKFINITGFQKQLL